MEVLLHLLLAVVLAPLLQGIITRIKAVFAGRQGPPLVQPYWDLFKLLQKGAVFSETTTWVFRVGPSIGLAVALICLLFVPLGNVPAALSFQGDLFFVIYLLGVLRFFTVLAAMDTGSAFEGMGASREVQFSALAEPALLVGLIAMARNTGSYSLEAIVSSMTPEQWMLHAASIVLVIAGFLIVYLAENSRIPVDDPTTHLELTMIHEVMILDHSGVDFGIIEYTAALKHWILGALIVGIVLPVRTGSVWMDGLCMFLGLVVLAIFVGVIESTMARLRLLQVPQLLVGACAFAVVGLLV